MEAIAKDASRDPEQAHVSADDLLVEFIRERGTLSPHVERALELYEEMEKWYA